MYQPMRQTAFALVLSVAGVGCAFPFGSGTLTRDHAGLRWQLTPARGEADSSGNNVPSETRLLALRPGAKRYVVLGRRSRLDVKGHDSMLGDHHLSFGRWWAHIETEPPTIVVEIDLRSLRSDEALVSSIVRDHVLEVDRYPRATLVGSLSATSREGEIVIDGVADVHGKQTPLRFAGELREEGDGYRLHASFDMSRRAFDLGYALAEPFLDDKFRVLVDAVASAERVEVEEP